MDINDYDPLTIEQYLSDNFARIRNRNRREGEIIEPWLAALLVFRHLAKTDPRLHATIMANSPHDTITEELYRRFRGETLPCPHGNQKTFKPSLFTYRFCGAKCACALEHASTVRKNFSEDQKAEIEEKKKKTMLARFGVEHNMHAEASLDRLKMTNRARYGVDCTLRAPGVMEKAQRTSMERYGAVTPISNKDIYAKTRETCRTRYGTPNYLASQDGKDKKIKTCQDRYGVDHHVERAEFREEQRLANMIKYGTPYTPVAQLTKDQHGVYPRQIAFTDKAREILFDGDALTDFITTRSINKAANELGVHRKTISNYCREHNIPITRGSSSYEREISAFLTGMGVPFGERDRTIIAPLELDFVIPQYNLAIEFNGLYWHSDAIVGKNYHRDKLQHSNAAGYRLIMINEDEWLTGSEKIKGKIRNIIQQSERGFGARKLTVCPLGKIPASDFLNRYHIQGAPGSIKIAYGAYHGDDLVSVMTFAPQRGKTTMELNRFCGDGRSHSGIFSKMFKHAIREKGFTEVVSFADLRYSQGDLYEKTGFTNEGVIPPDYKYIKGVETFHKSNFTLSKIETKFGITGLTEREAMKSLGYNRIYDCGKIRYRWVDTELSLG